MSSDSITSSHSSSNNIKITKISPYNDNPNENKFVNKLNKKKVNTKFLSPAKIILKEANHDNKTPINNKNRETEIISSPTNKTFNFNNNLNDKSINEIDISPIKKRVNNQNELSYNLDKSIIKKDTIYNSELDPTININQITITNLSKIENNNFNTTNKFHIVNSTNYVNNNPDSFHYKKGDINIPRMNTNDIKDLFQCFDINSGGSISAQELRYILTEIGENPTDEEIDEMIKLADLEGDGQVNYKSFYEFLNSCFN